MHVSEMRNAKMEMWSTKLFRFVCKAFAARNCLSQIACTGRLVLPELCSAAMHQAMSSILRALGYLKLRADCMAQNTSPSKPPFTVRTAKSDLICRCQGSLFVFWAENPFLQSRQEYLRVLLSCVRIPQPWDASACALALEALR